MTAVSIAVAISHIPSHRTSSNEVEGGLFSSFTREQFEMQEVSALAVVTLLIRYKTVYIKQCNFLQVEREERVERRIQNIGKKEGKFRGLRRKKESNEKLKENNTERNTLRAFQRDGEINDSDTEMQT